MIFNLNPLESYIISLIRLNKILNDKSIEENTETTYLEDRMDVYWMKLDESEKTFVKEMSETIKKYNK